jgi:hypothetical protein
VAENNLDGIERRLRAPGSQQSDAEEMLAELVRLVESSGLAPKGSAVPAETVADLNRTDTEQAPPVEMTSLRPSVEAPSSRPTAAADVEPLRASRSDNLYMNNWDGIDLATGRRSGTWTFRVPALVLAGSAVIGSIFWLERVEFGGPKAPPFIATAQGPSTAQPQSNLTVANSSGAAVTPPGDITQPVRDKVVSPEEPPTDLNASVSLKSQLSSADLGPTASGVAQPTADASAGKRLAESVDTPAPAEPIAASPPTASHSLDSKPVAAVSLPPDPAQIVTPSPSAMTSGAAHASDAPLPPVKRAPKAGREAAGVAQRSTPKLDLATKLSSKSAAHVVVAKADATGLRVPAETPGEPLQHEASVNPEKGAKTLKIAQAPTETQAAPPEQPAPAPQLNPNPVVHAFSSMVGALAGLIPFAPH